MTDIDQSVALDAEAPKSRNGKMKLFIIIGAALFLLAAAGGAAYFFLFAHAPADKKVEAPLPAFLTLKPFVVTVPSRDGPSHFVQLGVSFQFSGSDASNLVNAVLPKVQDAMRQTLLTFKAEDLQTPEGLKKARAAILTAVNQALVAALSQDRIDKANGGKPGMPLIKKIYFPTLVIE